MATLVTSDPRVVHELQLKLCNLETSLPEKYRILFSLRNVSGPEAQSAIELGLQDESVLFRHEVAYCLGQRQDPTAIAILTGILHNANEHPMVRHEAGEALGAIGTTDCMQPLLQHIDDPVQEVAETCQLALQRIKWIQEHEDWKNEESPYYSVDPCPALPASLPIMELRSIILDDKQKMFDRYSALFALRNKGGSEAASVLAEVFKCNSAILKHEVAYVLGQMQNTQALDVLVDVLKDPLEAAMVRHEAAESLGSIAAPLCAKLLQEYSIDPERIVADSCLVALDMLEHEHSGKFEYAITGSWQGGKQ